VVFVIEIYAKIAPASVRCRTHVPEYSKYQMIFPRSVRWGQ